MTKAPKKAASEGTGTTTTTTRKRTKKNVDQTTGTNGRSLIIVESPAKAKTINKYLGRDYIVEASIGHIKNLPKSKIGVDIDGGFIPEYETIKGKDEVIERLRTMAASCSEVYLATDPDREGEAIAWHIAREIHDLKSSVYRVLFHEITERGIAEAMQHPHRIDENLVVSQQARRVMDRLVGYKVSPFIWKTLFYGLSAGRVQSVALRLVAEREEAISSFVPEEYWSMIGEFATPRGESFLARLFKVREEDPRISSAEEADELSRAIRQSSFSVTDVQRKDVRRNPPPPFITSTLQQEAAKRLRYHAKRTMMLAQKLYEGIELGPEGRVGLITYMRTDSTRLSEDAVGEVRQYIYENYGKEYLPSEPRLFRKGKASQDAHEAIRPTSSRYAPREVKKFLDKETFALYELIWNRFVACQMNPVVLEQMTVDLKGGEFTFRATDSQIKFRGFLQAYEEDVPEEGERQEDEDPTSRLPAEIAPGQEAKLQALDPRQHFTKPPPRFTEGSLVKELEARGIGRPSTYALIIDTILARKYVEQRERRLYPTELGAAVNKILVRYFPHLFSVEFTARMEEELDTIASGRQPYEKVMEDFYRPFIRDLEGIEKNSAAIKQSLQEPTDEVCDLCGKPMIIKWGRNGRFMACSGYPSCKNTKPLPHEQEQARHAAGIKCDLCGGDMVVKGGRFGAFLGCSNYPKCKNTRPLSIGMKCPQCQTGDVIERKTKRKRVFYGCSRYPDCDFASWDKPVAQACETCGNSYMVQKYTQSRGEYLLCPSCKAEVAREEIQQAAG